MMKEVVHICNVCKRENKLKINVAKRLLKNSKELVHNKDGSTRPMNVKDKKSNKKINTAYYCPSCGTFYSLDLKKTFKIDFDW